MNRIIRYFSEVSMANGHKGLSEIAKNHKINMKSLGQGEFLIFVNKKQTALKMFTQGGMVGHFKHDRKIDLRTISDLPNYFNGSSIDYSSALRKQLEKDFGLVAANVKKTNSNNLTQGEMT